MAIQQLNLTPTPHPLGEAIGSGLEQLASHKMQQIQRGYQSQRTAKGLQALGFSPEQASSYSHLDPHILDLVVRQRLQEPSQQAFAQGLQSILGGAPQEPGMERFEFANNQSQQQPQLTPGEMIGRDIFGTTKRMSDVPTRGMQPQLQQEIAPRKQSGLSIPPGLNAQQATQLAQLALQKKAVTQKEESTQRKFEKKQEVDRQKQIDKETLPLYNEVLAKHKAAKDSDIIVNRMLKKAEEGKLPDSVYYKQLKDLEEAATPGKGAALGATSGGSIGGGIGGAIGLGLGGPVGAAIGGAIGTGVGTLTGALAGLAYSQRTVAKIGELRQKYPDIEEFEKDSASFIRNAKAIFGNRITDMDLKAFMATIPTIMNSDAGKKAIIKNMKIANEADHVQYKVMKQILEENGGRRPENFAILLSDRTEKELDRLANEFKEGFVI